MNSYALSKAADDDLERIIRDSILQWGIARADHDSHNIFYRKTESGILIIRILHHKQLPENYL